MGQELGLHEQYQVKQAFYAEVRLNYWLMYEVTSVSRRRKEKKKTLLEPGTFIHRKRGYFLMDDKITNTVIHL